MKATIEISMYSLSDSYEEKVIAFIQNIKRDPEIRVETNGLSTQLFGDYKKMMSILQDQMENVFEEGSAVFVLKIAKNELTKDALPQILQG